LSELANAAGLDDLGGQLELGGPQHRRRDQVGVDRAVFAEERPEGGAE